MGSPMVFHTAPPQPASKARITWPPVFVGGPEASQKGLGERKPQKLTLRSAMGHLIRTQRQSPQMKTKTKRSAQQSSSAQFLSVFAGVHLRLLWRHVVYPAPDQPYYDSDR